MVTALEQTSVGDCERVRVGELDAAETVRVGLAQALLFEPQLVVVDEPTATVPLTERDAVLALLRVIESVYEAAAHGRWAHRASLVVEAVAGQPLMPDAVQDEAERFRLGVYSMIRRAGRSWDLRQIRDPDLRAPEPENIDQLLRECFLADDGERQDYLSSLK